MGWVGLSTPWLKVYEKLEDWPALAATAQEGIRLHRGDPVRLAAGLRLPGRSSPGQWRCSTGQARQAEQALHILKVGGYFTVGAGVVTRL